MKLSTKARYGLRALVELAQRNDGKPVLIREIAANQNISLSYLEQLMSPLINGGIIRTIKGPKGGVLLNTPPSSINLSTVVQLLEGSYAPVDCVDHPNICERSEICVTRDIWVKVKEAITGVLESKTIQDLVDEQKEKILHSILADDEEDKVEECPLP